MKKTRKNPDVYLKSLPADVRDDMLKLDKEFSAIMTGLGRTLWEGVFWGGSEQNIIGYADHTYTGSGGKKVEWFLVGLALQKNYISVYVNVVDGKKYLAEGYQKKLGKAKVGKSVISFARLSDINLETLLELIRKSRAHGAANGQM